MLASRLVQAAAGSPVALGGARVRVPGSLRIRVSVVAGNQRIHRLMNRVLAPGAAVVDVGAHTGYNTVYAALRVGPSGRVTAIEPAKDNAALLLENVRRNALTNVDIHTVAAGRARGSQRLFMRGDHSAVNSLFPTSPYADVTSVDEVAVVPLDELVGGDVDLVKIDVEGSEIDVLGGMTRLLRSPRIRLIVEWHPALQRHAGYAIDALPRLLLDAGFTLETASHLRTAPLPADAIEAVAERLLRRGRPVELFARR